MYHKKVFTLPNECDFCDEHFTNSRLYNKHIRLIHSDKVFYFNCEFCKSTFNESEKLRIHYMSCKKFNNNISCNLCGKHFKFKSTFIKHKLREINQIGSGSQKLPNISSETHNFVLSKSAFKNYLQQYELYPDEDYKDTHDFFYVYYEDIQKLMKLILPKVNSIKVQFCLQVTFYKTVSNIKIFTIAYFTSDNYILSAFNNTLNNKLINMFDNKIQTFESIGSGWIIDSIDRLDIRIALYNPIKGGCNNSDLPDFIKNKKAVISIENKDQKCFMWSSLVKIALLYTKKYNFKKIRNLSRMSTLTPYKNFVNFKNISFPISLKDIKKFETNNKHLDIRVNVYGIEKLTRFKSGIIPLYISKKKSIHTLKLLFYNDHFYYINNFNRLCGSFESTYHHFCKNCLSGFRTNFQLENHKRICQHFNPSAAIMPEKNIMKFTQISYLYKFPFVIYADFESLLVKENQIINRKTKQIHKHIASGFSIVAIKNDSEIYYKYVYSGKYCLNKFLEILATLSYLIYGEISNPKCMVITDNQRLEHDKAEICYLCLQKFDDLSNEKVYDHDHMTGKYRGPAHKLCNLQYQIPIKIPLFFHNLKNYDSHFIINSLKNNYFSKCTIIPNSMEKYIAMELDNIKVLDSCQFLNESLDKLVKNLRASNGNFPITSAVFKNKIPNDEYDMLFRKCPFPYEYFDDWSRFNERELPAIEKFYSSLNNSTISLEDYKYVKKVWEKLNFKNLKEFQNFYCLLDTCLLADVFQTFRNMIYKTYTLDPCHFYSIPGLSWCAALKLTKVEIELFKDIDMYMFIEKGIRGGICNIMKRYAVANNKYCNNYDDSKETTFLAHYDVNNLYGKSLSEKLPLSDFEWVDPTILNKINWNMIDTDNEIGYILECDLIYPQELHDLHKDFPLAPEKNKINNDQLSTYQKTLLSKLKQFGYRRYPTNKLLLTLNDKPNYILHFKNLKLYLELGLKLKTIHRGIKFKQSNFLKSYITINTDLRKKATNDFEKDLYKLMNNSAFGKSIQNMRNLIDIKVGLDRNQVNKCVQKLNFDTFQILNEDIALIKMKKTKVLLNKPIFIGFTVLELSKHYMYTLHYKAFKHYYNENIQLLYTDTDSLIYEIKTQNLYKDLKNYFNPIMDFSNFNKSHPLFNEKNKKAIGFIKSEIGEKIMNEIVCLKPKLYSILYDTVENKKVAKGVKKNVINNNLNHDIYKNVLLNEKYYNTTMNTIQSKQHILKTLTINKFVFHPMDDKTFILQDGVTCLPFGHKSIIN